MHLTCKRYKLIRLITPLMCFSPPPLRTRTNEMSGRETIRGISVLSAVKKLLFLQGWAQINGRDDIPIPRKVECDEYYLMIS
jgi:lipopolysaccharide/colanic/teichoic acid biosynthesis glycosyltransferase